MAYYILIAAVIAADRLVKYLTASQMIPGETIPVIRDVFHITYVQNRGAAFSMMEGQTVFLVILPAAALTAALVLLIVKHRKWNTMLNVSVALICGGGTGNVIDRMMQGYVVDTFDFRVFPVFNIADIAICVGCGLLLLDVLLSERKDRRNAK